MLHTIPVLFSLTAPIVGGTTVPAGSYTDVVLVVAPKALCTGTLVAPDVVLTAGHCIETDPKEVLVDSVDYAKPGGELIGVKSAIAYPDWQHHYDVGVLVLEHAAAPHPRAVADRCTLKAGGEVHVVGFGLTSAAGTGDNTRLHQASLTVHDPTCARTPGCMPAIAPNGEFVAGGAGIDTCFGDSGGPLYAGGALIGVVSRGLEVPGQPCGGGGIYVRADQVVGWVEHVTNRKLARSDCEGPADHAAADETGGCNVGAVGAGWLVVTVALIAAALIGRRRK